MCKGHLAFDCLYLHGQPNQYESKPQAVFDKLIAIDQGITKVGGWEGYVCSTMSKATKASGFMFQMLANPSQRLSNAADAASWDWPDKKEKWVEE